MLDIIALNDLALVLCNKKILVSFWPLATAEKPQHCALVGLSALAEGPMDSRSFVRASVRSFVRDPISGDPHIRFF